MDNHSTAEGPPSTARSRAFLAVILLGAAIPRCWAIWQQGVEDYDGANFTLEAQLAVTVADGVAHKITKQPYEFPTLPQVRGRPFVYAKPLYSFSLVPGWIVRIPRVDIAPIFSAAWSLATLLVIYRVAKELWGVPQGILAAAFFGASGFSAYFARLGAAESFGFFCLTIAMWRYAAFYKGLSPTVWRALGIGILWGLAILANYRLLLTIAIILSVGESMSLLRVGTPRLKISLAIAAGLFGTMLLTEAGFQVGLRVWQSLGGKFSTLTYFNQLHHYLFERYGIAHRFNVDWRQNLYDFAHYLAMTETWPLILWAAVGVVLSIIRPARLSRPDCVYAVAGTLAAILWTLQHYIAPRAVGIICLFLPLFAASITWEAAKRLRVANSRFAPLLLLIGYAALLAGMTYRIGFDWFSQPSGFRELPAAVAQAGDVPLCAYWRQKPAVSLYVVDRPISQISDERLVDQNPLPSEGLLVAESDFVADRYPDAEVLGRWPTRRAGNVLALAEDLWSWDDAIKRKNANIELLLVRLKGPPQPGKAPADGPVPDIEPGGG